MKLSPLDRACLWIHNVLMGWLGIKVVKITIWTFEEKK